MTGTTHHITWWVYVGSGADKQRIRRTSTMRGRWDFDATCTCGWDSQTGGAVRGYVTRAVADHKWDAAALAEFAATNDTQEG